MAKRASPAEVAIERAKASGVPAEALAAYARWWQLETWLRQLVNIELRARYGVAWANQLAPDASVRAAKERAAAYSSSPDAENALAFLDVSKLLEIIANHWELFSPSLIPSLTAWRGRVEELHEVRHRVAHARRPHRDDVRRIEQLLRDLEPGAKRSIGSYNNSHPPDPTWNDPLVRAWVHHKHKTASRLVGHAEQRYDTRFSLNYSLRPWFGGKLQDGLTGKPGVVWEAVWVTSLTVWPDTLWHYDYLDRHRDLMINLLMASPNQVRITYSGVDDQQEIADAIGLAFDAILLVGERHESKELGDTWQPWRERGSYLEPRAQIDTWLAMFDPHQETPVTIFGA